jgi:hypothetical protein
LKIQKAGKLEAYPTSFVATFSAVAEGAGVHDTLHDPLHALNDACASGCGLNDISPIFKVSACLKPNQ